MARYYYLAKSNDAYTNLSTDEALLESLQPDDFLLYFYCNARAVIIGRNQNAWRECDLTALQRDKVQLVRRCSGGGAVYHDLGNLNFSFMTGRAHYDLSRQFSLVCDALMEFDLAAELSGRNDLTLNGRKFSGNAFLTRGEIRQHHGTLLVNGDLGVMQRYLKPDPEKLRSKGVASVRARVCNLNEFDPRITVEALQTALLRACERNGGALAPYAPSKAVLEKAEHLRMLRSAAAWVLGESPAFDFRCARRFSFGQAELCLTIKRGVVESAVLYTDALDPNLSDEIRAALIGVPFLPYALADALSFRPELAAFVSEQAT